MRDKLLPPSLKAGAVVVGTGRYWAAHGSRSTSKRSKGSGGGGKGGSGRKRGAPEGEVARLRLDDEPAVDPALALQGQYYAHVTPGNHYRAVLEDARLLLLQNRIERGDITPDYGGGAVAAE